MLFVIKSVIVFVENVLVYLVEVIDLFSMVEEFVGSSVMFFLSYILVFIEFENFGECKYFVCKYNRFVMCCLFSEFMYWGFFFLGIVNFMYRFVVEVLIINF